MAGVRASDVYLTAAGVVELTGVSVARLTKWVRMELIQGVAVERAGHPGDLVYLYCLEDMQELAARERQRYLEAARRWNARTQGRK